MKSVGQEVVKLGFPVSSLEKLIGGREYEKTYERTITVHLHDGELIDGQYFSNWKSAVFFTLG